MPARRQKVVTGLLLMVKETVGLNNVHNGAACCLDDR
jgi:hypothetical protein